MRRYRYVIGLLCLGFGITQLSGQSTKIKMEETSYEGADHFVVRTSTATYYYDKAGGGLSRLIDKEGLDWIHFKKEPWDSYPAAAATSYRGLPNFVFRSDEGGAGHPGHDKCTSEWIGKNQILTTSKSGRWQWRWTFYPQFAIVELLKIPTDTPYWFLYEGTPGGIFEPSKQYYGTIDGGPDPTQLDFYKGNKAFGQWQWAYFGHKEVSRSLLIIQQEEDNLSDTFSYLGNTEAGIQSKDGMVVFGFGRAEGAQPQLVNKNAFLLSLSNKAVKSPKDHQRILRKQKRLLHRMKKLTSN